MSAVHNDPSFASNSSIARTSIVSGVIAAAFALASFSISVIAGLSSGNSAEGILVRSLIVLIASYPLGLIAGMICQYVVQGHIEEHETTHPLPEPSDEIRQMMAENSSRSVNEAQQDAEQVGAGEQILEV